MIKKVTILITIKIFIIVKLLNHFTLSVSMKCFLSPLFNLSLSFRPTSCSLFCSKFLFSLEKLCLHCLKSPTLPVCLFSCFSVSREFLSSRALVKPRSRNAQIFDLGVFRKITMVAILILIFQSLKILSGVVIMTIFHLKTRRI